MKNYFTRLFTLSCLLVSALDVSGQGFTLSAQVIPASCYGSCNGSIILTVSGGSPGNTFDWSNDGPESPDNDPMNLTNICAGTYTVTVTGSNGIAQTASVTVTQPSQIVLSTCVTNATCNGLNNGRVDLTVSGGTAPYTYIWSNGSTVQDPNGLTAGTYTPTVTDANNCTVTTAATVTEPASLTVTSAVANSTNGNANGGIDLTISGGTPPYTYLWSNGSTSQDLSGLVSGVYKVTVWDANGCTREHTVIVQDSGSGTGGQVQVNVDVVKSGCGASCTGAIQLSPNGGSGAYTYQWQGPNGYTSSQQNLINVCPGSYCVTVNDVQIGYSFLTCYYVGQGVAQPVVIQSSNAAFCNYDSNGPTVCEMVCPHTSVTYFFEPPANCGQPLSPQGVVWTVSGAEQYTVNPNNKEIVVTWGEAGPGLVTLSSGTSSMCFETSRCITVVEEPVAKFSTDPPAPANVPLQLCKGQTVSFKNESLHAEQFEWLFSDNLSSVTDANPSHTFLTPGNFTVTLIARSNCLCSDTTVMLVEVLDSEPPLLDCVGSVCPGETVKYSTSANCSSYTWTVSPNGSVLQGGNASDNTITVQWGDGPTGSIALAATGCGGAACPQASVFFIPIISDNAEIRGNEFVCPGSEEEYSIDLFDGTEYTWTLPAGGTIVSGQGTNVVNVAWTASANSGITRWLSVEYYNCYLGCGGQDSIPVKILQPFYIQGAVEKCEQAPGTFNAKLINSTIGVNANWVIYQENGAVFWTSPSPGTSLSFPTNAPPGKYRIYATPVAPGVTCSPDAELVVSVVARPPKPASIAGPTLICPGTPLTYQIPGSAPYTVQWTAFNGNPGTQSGNPVNVSWLPNTGRWLSANYASTDGLGCKSDTAKLDIAEIFVLSISGTPGVCEGAIGHYTADAYENVSYQWEILPAGAGAIKSGQGKNAVDVFWQSAGNHVLRLTTCNLTTNFNVAVWPNPAPIATYPDGLCPGDSGLVSTTVPFTDYSWQKAGGGQISTAASPEIPAGSYAVEVTDVHGCRGSVDFKIDQYPTPNVTVTTADPTGFCNNSAYVSLTALVPEDGNYTFDWLQDGTSVGAASPVYITNQYGLFTTIATNEYGCKAKAPAVLLYNYCLGGGGGFCPNPSGNPPCAPGSVQAVPDPTTRCDSIRLVLNDYTGQYVPGSATWWTGISGGVLVGTAVGDSPSFIYPNAGKYIVILQATLQNGSVCEAIDSVDIEAVAQFSHRLACPGDSTRFVDESTRLPEANITAWQWDFGEAGLTDTSSLASPGHPFAVAGNYAAMLTITAASGCTSSYSENVFVPTVPAPAYVPPLANCAGNATPFALTNAAGIIKTLWDFGDPASGALNQSSGDPVYHNYSPAGNYPVTIEATNTYGCKGTATQPVSIIANPFSGIITPMNPVMCEGKTLTLIAPAGPGATYVWSDGTNLPTLTVNHEGIYDVTLTNGNGCSYSPPDKTVEVNPAPVGVIKALDINDLGQVIGVSYPTLSVCEGEDVNLQIQDNGVYSYQWSGGNGVDETLVFSEDRDNLLSVGIHTYTVTVTNATTGCTVVLAPFEVTVNPTPSGFSLATNSVCAGTPSTITYTGPQPPEWQIFWNTGETGPALTTEDAGLYFVRVVNEFGCSAQSNTVVIFPGPNIAALPSGCHERCNPDTLCLPPLPEIVAWQWYYEGNPVPGATSHQFVATQSGTYYAQLLDVNGCQAQSADLTVELYDGFGNILGQVWSDVNDNGIIDATDTLVAFIPVQLLQNGTLVNTTMSGLNGGFNWQNVLSTSYTVQIDSQALSPQWEVVILSDSVGLSGCGGKVYADLLVDAYTCPPIFSSVTLTACPGDAAIYNGTPVLAGQSQDFNLPSFLGCDSIVTVTVNALPVSTGTFSAQICPGSTYTYEGVDLSVGQTQDFTLTNYLGCDSIVTVTISALPVSTGTFSAQVCPGSTYTYEGVDLSVGQTQDFTLTNYLGCDSIVTVTVGALPVSTGTFNPKVCPGTTYTYEQVDLVIGQTQDFTLTNYLGCDSIVTVTVGALPVSTGTFNPKVCPGTTYTYEQVDLAVGQTQDFTLTNYLGCDSIVTVTVGALPVSTGTFNPKVCPGTTYTYEQVDLAIGQTQDFTLTNYLGCDSIVTVTVGALPVSTGTATFGVCPDETYTYEHQSLPAGTVKDFTLTNWLGCDSIVTVTVYEKASSAELREINVCPGQLYEYNGVTVAPGQVKDIHFTNGEGCDSLITISVSAFPALDVAIESEATCPTNGTGTLTVQVASGGSTPVSYALNGGATQSGATFTALAAGAYTVTVQDDNGCLFESPATIEASPNLELALPDAFVIPCDSAQITLTPVLGGDTAGLQLIWWNGATTPTVTTGEATPVWLDASNHCGEKLHREAEVAWANSDGEPLHIYVPNIFAPAAKNVENTTFRAFFGNNFTLLEYRIEVYDRWGNMLFESEQPELGWDGAFANEIMDPGVYVWQLWAKLAFCGRVIDLYKKGDVTVER